HDPRFGMWLPVAVLVAPVLAVGLFPAVVAGAIVETTAEAAAGAPRPAYPPARWRAVTPARLLTRAASAGAALLLIRHAQVERLRLQVPRPEAKAIFDAAVAGALRAARWSIDRLHTESLSRYLAAIVATIVVGGTAGFLAGTHA